MKGQTKIPPMILVVSKEPDLANIRARILQDAGYRVESAMDLNTFKTLCEVHTKVDLVIIGYSLPVHEKRRVWEAAKKACKDTPILELYEHGRHELLENNRLSIHEYHCQADFLASEATVTGNAEDWCPAVGKECIGALHLRYVKTGEYKNMSFDKDPIKMAGAEKESFDKESKKPEKPRPVVTDRDRNDESRPKPLVKIVNYSTGAESQASLEELNEQMREFHKVILLIEDQSDASDACAKALHELGYDGVQLITRVPEAEQHLDDIVSNLTAAPAAIILDLGLGNESGFSVLRKCHAEPKLQKLPILVWTKHTESREKAFSEYLGAEDFLVKSGDEHELRKALTKLLVVPKAA